MLRTNGAIQLYPVARLIVMLIIGILIGEAVKDMITPLVWFSALCIGLVINYIVRERYLLQSVMVQILVILLGGWLITDAEQSLITPLPAEEVEYEAVLISEPVTRGKVLQMDVIVKLQGQNFKAKASLLRDTVENRYKRLHVGDGIRAYSLLEYPKNYGNSSFDYARWLLRHGYKAQTFIYYCDWIKAEVDLRSLSYFERADIATKKIRQRLANRFYEFGLDGSSYAVTVAMTLGDKSMLGKELRESYSASGASHILALSGLHLGIIYTMLSFLFRRFRRGFISSMLILSTIWAYVFIVGMTPSVLRSAIMLTIYSLVELLQRDHIPVNTLAVAAMVMLLVNPFNLYDIGFQLSFMAVLGILIISPVLYTFVPTDLLMKHRILKWLFGIIIISISAQIGTAPLVACHFGKLPVYFLLTNIIVAPLATAIIYSAILFFACMKFPFIQAYIIKIITWLSNTLNISLEHIASLPYSSIDGIHISALQTFLIYLIICGVVIVVAYFRRDVKRFAILT